MSDTLQRAVVRAVACAAMTFAAVGVWAACGFTTSATGTGAGDADVLFDAGRPSDNAEGGDASQGACSRTVCGTACTDLTADPENCGACGAKCPALQTCSDGQCTVLCISDQLRCGDTCVEPATDPKHCGSCTVSCDPGKVCVSSVCAADCGALQRCGDPTGADAGAPVYCANIDNDAHNCGACGITCKANEVCKGAKCTAVCATGSRVGDIFAANMVGCVAQKVGWDSRAISCGPGSAVCSASDWVARRNAKVPTFNYWTNDNLEWLGSASSCRAVANGGNSCATGGGFFGPGTNMPMRVCAAKTDPVGNNCTWTNCGLGTVTPNLYFGGCQGNDYASTLCCTP